MRAACILRLSKIFLGILPVLIYTSHRYIATYLQIMDLHTYLVIAALNSQVQSAQISQDTSNYSREPTYYVPQPTYSAPVPTYTPPTRFIGSPPSNANQWEDRQTRQIQERHRSYPNLDYSTHVTYGEKDVDHLVDLRSSQLSTSTRTRVAKTSASLLSAVPSQKFFAPRVVSTGTEGYYQRNLGLSKEDTQDEAYMMKIRKASGREPVHEIKKFVQKGVKKTVRDINRGNLREAGGAISRNLHEFGEHVAPHVGDLV